MTLLRSAIIAYKMAEKTREIQIVEMKSLFVSQVWWRRVDSRRLKMQLALNNLAARRRRVFNLASLLLLLVSQMNITVPRPVRTCRRLKRNTGWWHTKRYFTHLRRVYFRALEARGTPVFNSSRNFVAKQVVRLWKIHERCRTLGKKVNLFADFLVSTLISIPNDTDIYFARRNSHPLLTDLVDNFLIW